MELREALPEIVTETVPGPKAAAVLARRKEAIPSAIGNPYPCVIQRGAGAVFEDLDGNIFLDWVGGVGVLNVGYSHPEIVQAVKDQADHYFHAMMNIVTHEGYIALAEKLNQIVPVRGEKKRTFFANSGAEADENAVKLAKAFTGRPNIIVFTGAFHGRTVLTMAMTSKKSYARGMGPFPDGIFRAEFPNMYRRPEGMTEEEAVDYYVKKLEEVFEWGSPAEYVAAVVVEPIQGEGGFIPAPVAWARAVREICDRHGILMIADEVQCGFCRSGKMFASEYWKEAGCEPDILATAKSIAAGVPLSAIVAREEIAESVKPGVIGGTFCGNALGTAAALKTIEIMERDRLADRALELGKLCTERFLTWKKYGVIGDVRGVGAMMGIEFVKDETTKEPYPELVASIVQEAAARGLVLESAGTYLNVIRMLCPLVVTDEQMEAGFQIMEKALVVSLEKLGRPVQ